MMTANLQAILEGSDTQREFARAIEQLMQAVVSEAGLQENDKQEVVEAIATLSQPVAKKTGGTFKGNVEGAGRMASHSHPRC